MELFIRQGFLCKYVALDVGPEWNILMGVNWEKWLAINISKQPWRYILHYLNMQFWCSCNRNGERVRGLFSICNLNHASCKPASWPANQWFDLQAKVIFTNTWHLVSTNSGCWPWIEVEIKDNKRWQRIRVFKCPGFTSLKTTVNILK